MTVAARGRPSRPHVKSVLVLWREWGIWRWRPTRAASDEDATAGDELRVGRPLVSVADQASMACRSLLVAVLPPAALLVTVAVLPPAAVLVTAILRGLAFSATGMRSVRTPPS